MAVRQPVPARDRALVDATSPRGQPIAEVIRERGEALLVAVEPSQSAMTECSSVSLIAHPRSLRVAVSGISG
jgi:hypothetical protein